jgi:hypothetical protein
MFVTCVKVTPSFTKTVYPIRCGLHCNRRTKASKDNDNCSEGLMPAKAMQKSEEEAKDTY